MLHWFLQCDYCRKRIWCIFCNSPLNDAFVIYMTTSYLYTRILSPDDCIFIDWSHKTFRPFQHFCGVKNYLRYFHFEAMEFIKDIFWYPILRYLTHLALKSWHYFPFFLLKMLESYATVFWWWKHIYIESCMHRFWQRVPVFLTDTRKNLD